MCHEKFTRTDFRRHHLSLLFRRLYSRNSVHLSSQFGDFSVIFFGKRCIFLIQTGQTGLLEYKYLTRFFIIFSAAMTDFIKSAFIIWTRITRIKTIIQYSTIMSFYYIRSRERAKYEAVIHYSVLV